MASFVSNVNELASKLDVIVSSNDIFDAGVIPVLEEIANLDLALITEDLRKGNYLGGRKLDMDLSTVTEVGGSVSFFEQVNIVTVDGVVVTKPFYAYGTTTISETSSPSIILGYIKEAITAYNDTQVDAFTQIRFTEFDLLNETDITKPTVIQIRDTDGRSSDILRIELLRYVGREVSNFTWTATTSALQTLSDKVAVVIEVGQQIDNIIEVSSKIDELLILQNNVPQLVTNTDSLYLNIANLNVLYDEMIKLITLYDDVKAGGTNYVNTVGEDLQSVESKITKISDDLVLGASGVLAKIVTNIDNLQLTKVVQAIDDGSVDKLVTNIDNSVFSTLTSNITGLQDIVTNITDILDAKNQPALAEAQVVLATLQANIATTQAGIATDKANEIQTLSATALSLAEGSAASTSYDSGSNTLSIGVPKGDKGDRGEAFNVDITGISIGRNAYDDQPQGFSYLATDTGNLYIKLSATSADWSDPIPFGKGDKGDTGVGVASVTFTGTTDPSGLAGKLNAVDTYTILNTDGSTYLFTVSNGADRTVVSANSNYLASREDLVICDTTPVQQYDEISSVVVVASSIYSVDINGNTASYTSDPYANQTDTVSGITVTNGTDYSITTAINGVTVTSTYSSDAAVAQVDTLGSAVVADGDTYAITINGTPISYTGDTAVAQVNTLTNTVVLDNSTFTVEINGTPATYTSDAAVAQVDTLDSIVVVNSQTYAITVNGTEASYVSSASATELEIVDGLVLAVNNDATIGAIVTASSGTGSVILTADVAGVAFTTVVTSGTATLTTTIANNNATETEILNGIKDAINSLAEPVTAASITGGLKVTSDIAGTGFTITVTTGNITDSVFTVNDNTTDVEIAQGLVDAVNASTEPIVGTIIGTDVILTAFTPGDAFTTAVTSGNITLTNTVSNNNTTLSEVVAGLVGLVNSGTTGLTAIDKSTYLTIVADVHTDSFTTSVSANMSVSSVAAEEALEDEILTGIAVAINGLADPVTATANLTTKVVSVTADTVGVGYTIAISSGSFTLASIIANKEGISVLTLPANPTLGDSVTVVDMANSFVANNLTVARNSSLIQGLAEDLVIDVNNVRVEFLYSGNDWRYE